MTITDYNFLIRLKTEKINCSAIPKTVKGTDYFDNFLNSGVIVLEGNSGRGTIKLNENEKDYFEKFLENHFKDTPEDINNKSFSE